jgi:hypothetical protein
VVKTQTPSRKEWVTPKVRVEEHPGICWWENMAPCSWS